MLRFLNSCAIGRRGCAGTMECLNWEAVERLFHAAKDLPEDERDALLAAESTQIGWRWKGCCATPPAGSASHEPSPARRPWFRSRLRWRDSTGWSKRSDAAGWARYTWRSALTGSSRR